MGIQDFGPHFDLEKFYHARDVARDMAYELSTLIRPGMVEDEAHVFYKNLCLKYGVQKNWHPPKLRFGPNTLKTFKEPSEPYVLQEEDIFYLDIGPVVDGHEADYGETFTLGSNYDHKHVAECSRKLFHEVAHHWKETKLTGAELYAWASQRAQELGYHLNMGSDGHRIGDFPHHLFFKGALVETEEQLLPNAWILEIQLDHPQLKFGAFYEDILR